MATTARGSIRRPAASIRIKALAEKVAAAEEDDGSLLAVLIRTFKVAGISIAVWTWGYFGFSIAWVYITLFFHIAHGEYRKQKVSKKLYAQQAVLDERSAIQSRVGEQLSWVYFPELEKAEWVNKIIKQMWPFIADCVKGVLLTSIQHSIQDSMKSFKFEEVDIGDVPPRIEGLKMYTDAIKKDEIICDLDINYTSDAKISVQVQGVTAGITTVQVSGTLRVIMKPLINDVPIIGGLSVFFLNKPAVSFTLTNAANVLNAPGVNKSLKDIVDKQIAYYLVLPNRFPIPLSSSLDATALAMLKHPLPQGVIALRVLEAEKLKAADKNLLMKANSDPYCKITVGARTMETKVISKSLNPQWNEQFEMIVDQKHGQFVLVEVFDHDTATGDDSLGIATLDIEMLAREGFMDSWLPLEDVPTGKIHLDATWLNLNEIRCEPRRRASPSSAILMVTLESAANIPASMTTGKERSAFVKMKLSGNQKNVKQSTVRQASSNPIWGENFQFLIISPDDEKLELEVFHQGSAEKKLSATPLIIPLCNILSTDECTSREYDVADAAVIGRRFKLILRLCMRYLTPATPVDTDSVKQPALQGPIRPMSIPGNVPPTQTIAAREMTPPRFTTEENLVAGSAKMATSSPTQLTGRDVLTSDRKSSSRESTPGSEGKFGKIRLTIRYAAQRGQLVVVIHECKSLIPCDKDNLADPYVRIYIQPDRNKSTRQQTKMVKNNLNPTFDQTFEWTMTLADASTRTLDIAVKNDVTLFSKSRTDMGQAQIPLGQFGDLMKTTTDWFDLTDPAHTAK